MLMGTGRKVNVMKTIASMAVLAVAFISVTLSVRAEDNLTDKQKEAALMNSYASDGIVQMKCRDVLWNRFTNTPNVYLKNTSNDLVYVPEKVFIQCMDIYMSLYPEKVKRLKELGVDLKSLLK